MNEQKRRAFAEKHGIDIVLAKTAEQERLDKAVREVAGEYKTASLFVDWSDSVVLKTKRTGKRLVVHGTAKVNTAPPKLNQVCTTAAFVVRDIKAANEDELVGYVWQGLRAAFTALEELVFQSGERMLERESSHVSTGTE